MEEENNSDNKEDILQEMEFVGDFFSQDLPLSRKETKENFNILYRLNKEYMQVIKKEKEEEEEEGVKEKELWDLETTFVYEFNYDL
jgi:hypothetical protein